MDDITFITGPQNGETGVGDYTNSLIANLNGIDAQVLSLPKSDLQFSSYLIPAIQAIKGDSDLIHVQHEYGLFGPFSLMTLLFFPLLYVGARVKEKPVVVTIHESLNHQLTVRPFPRVKGLYILLLNRCIVSCSDHLIFLSENAREEFAESVSLPACTVLPHGVDLHARVDFDCSEAREYLEVDDEKPVIVEPGYISPRKGCHHVVNLAKQLPEYTFVLAGGPEDDSQHEYVQSLAEAASSNLTLTGRLNTQEFHAAFVAADVIVLPYHAVVHKGIVNTVNQSGIFNWCAAYGVPTVGSDCTYFTRLEEQWGCIATVNVKNSSLFGQEVSELVSDESRKKELSQAILRYAHKNSLNRIAHRHISLYNTLE